MEHLIGYKIVDSIDIFDFDNTKVISHKNADAKQITNIGMQVEAHLAEFTAGAKIIPYGVKTTMEHLHQRVRVYLNKDNIIERIIRG